MSESPCMTDRALRPRHEPSPYDVLIDRVSGAEFNAARTEARGICGGCPLMAGCFRANRDEQWVRAITGHDVRKAPSERATCGTPAGYQAHLKSHERPCDPCAIAERDRARRRKTIAEVATCGSESGYTRHRRLDEPACEDCKQAHRIAERDRARRRKEAAA